MIVMICSLSAPVSFAGEGAAFVRSKVKQMDPVYAGQRIPFYLTLYAKTRFTGSPRFDLPRVPGLILMEIEDRPVLGSATENEADYLIKTHEFAAFPQREGSFTIPSFTVSFAYVDIKTNKAIEGTYKTTELTVAVARPPGTESIDSLISTSEFKIIEIWDPKPENPRVGDAFKRTITMTAKDIPGMVFLPVVPEKVKGLGLYETPPSVQDNMERGEFLGKRMETITYVCEEEGSFKLPGMTFYWFDILNKELKKETLNPVEFKVSKGPLNINEGSSKGNKSDPFSLISRQALLVIIGIGILLLGFFRYKKTLTFRYNLWREEEGRSEKAFFREFEKTCLLNDDQKTIQALFNWLDRLIPERKSMTVKELFSSFHDPELLNAFNALERRLYGDSTRSTPGSNRELLSLVRQYRRSYLKKQSRYKIRDKGLKPLNL